MHACVHAHISIKMKYAKNFMPAMPDIWGNEKLKAKCHLKAEACQSSFIPLLTIFPNYHIVVIKVLEESIKPEDKMCKTTNCTVKSLILFYLGLTLLSIIFQSYCNLQWCLDVAGSLMLTFRVLPQCSIQSYYNTRPTSSDS